MAETWRVLQDGDQPSGGEPPAVAAAPQDRRRLHLLLAGAIAVAMGACVWLLLSGPSGGNASAHTSRPGAAAALNAAVNLPSAGADATDAPATPATLLVVEVDGAVRRPGVYRVASEARVGDVIAGAGGYAAGVDALAAQAINLAARVTDGQQIHVPARSERSAGAVQGAASDAGGAGPSAEPASGGGPRGPVNLNTASAAELDALPGIGPVTAARIIAARGSQPFATVDQLRERKIVGQATMEKLRDLVTVR